MPEQPQPPHIFSKLAEELVSDLRGGIESGEPRRSVKRPAKNLAEVVDQLLTKHQIGRASPEQTIRDHWVEVVGHANAAYSHAATIERNRLVVLASHSVVRNELFHHREQIVAKVRRLPGCGAVKSLLLRAG